MQIQSFILDTLKSSFRTRAYLCYKTDVLYSVHGEVLKSRYFHFIAKAWTCIVTLQLLV